MDYLKQVGQALGLVKFELAKFKPHLQMAKTRYELVSSKRERLQKQNRRECAALLAQSPPALEKARLRAEAIIALDFQLEAYAVLAAAVVDDPDLWAECTRKARTLQIEQRGGSTQADRLELFASLQREFAKRVAVEADRTTTRRQGHDARRRAREKERE